MMTAINGIGAVYTAKTNSKSIEPEKLSNINQLQTAFENILKAKNVGSASSANIQTYSDIVPYSGIVTEDIDKPSNDHHWPFGVVPYTFDPALTLEERTIMRAGMDMISSQTNITFIELPDNNNDGVADAGPKDYITFTRSKEPSVSYSSVGMVGGQQLVKITEPQYGATGGNVAHELMHALGFKHAQQHPDRDSTIEINTENIEPGRGEWFDIVNDGTIVGPYDPDSIMHYGTYFFSNGGPTIEIKEGVTLPEGVYLGQNDHLSSGDIAAINKVYPANGDGKLNGFDAQYYLEQNPKVADSVGHNNYRGAYIHWHTHGVDDGRSPSLAFDPKFYLEHNEDVAKAVGKDNYRGAYDHWLRHGISEGRVGSPNFDPTYYATEHPELNLVEVTPAYDLPGIGIDINGKPIARDPIHVPERVVIDYEGALNHWLQTGKDEGLSGSPTV